MKVMRRLGASILCMIMGIAFGIPGNLLVANAAGSSFTIPIQDFVNDTITSQTATIKLTNTTYQSYNKTDDCYVQMVQFDNSEDYSGWFAEIEDNFDEGYTAFAYNVYVDSVILSDDQIGAINADITIPVPEGYAPSSFYRLYCNGSYDKVKADSYTDTTVTYPITLSYNTSTDLEDNVVSGTLSCECFVEMRQTIDISTLKSSASLSSTAYEYTGSAIEPTVTITGLTKDTDYTVSYSNNTAVGTGTVTITGKGVYTGTFTLEFSIFSAVGTEEESSDGEATYKITSSTDGNYEVEYVAPKNNKKSKVTIPDTVTLADGTVAKVTSISSGAFKNNTKIRTLTIGKNVKTIEKTAFQKCTNLTKVTLGSSVTVIDNKAFQGCSKLKTITINSTSITKIGKNSLKGISSNATIKVPKKKVNAYKKLIKKSGAPSTVKIKKK